MLEKIKKVDLWLIDNVYQKIADKIWEICPINNFVLAQIFLALFCSWFIFVGPDFLQKTIPPILVFGLNYRAIIELKNLSHSKFMNPARVLPRCLFSRMWIFFFSVVTCVTPPHNLIDVLMSGLFHCHYFMACQPRPPIERFYRKLAFE